MIFLQTAVYAHRGASAAFRENTVEAFRGAAAMGADWVELDVRRTADGGLAVHHDAHLADGRAIVETLATELPASLPSLASALEACAPLGVNVEIKNWPDDIDFDPEARIAESVARAIEGRVQPIIVSSFHAPTLERVRAIGPGVPTAQLTFLLKDPDRAIEAALAAGHVALHPHDGTVTPHLVELAHARGLALNVWTVDDPERIRELAEMGVDGIVTNVPDVALAALGRGGRRPSDSTKE